jgi:hypothetical protein
VAPQRLPSLDLIAEEVRSEREGQLRHFEALDAKAGIILGFSGALVALAPSGSPLLDVARFAALASGLMALTSFWPRGYWSTNLRQLRDLYLASEPEFTRLNLLDTQIAMTEDLSRVLSGKAGRLKWAMGLLVAAILITAVGLAVD